MKELRAQIDIILVSVNVVANGSGQQGGKLV
jgi:hypothetical protein